ncbi:MAG: hypothetical protein VKP70_12075 [Cyanobacteriota bacterium]|nr:hypothetical protein [Cyanobacteriota bacterium]
MGLVLILQVLLTPAPANALSWRLPGGATPSSPRPAGDNGSRHLQEVAPPAWVQKARLALEDRDPTVSILAPADGDLLPDGPWTLRLRVEDWPLVDGGPLGLGPHLVVQLDGEPPRPTVETTVAMPPLSPGSHLLTVYAAKPWGEAHKSPLAVRQIRLHRLAPNPATLPAPHSPQLIPVSPMGPAGPPPLLIDWLLIDAPLQGLRADTSGWRLRLTVNGESVLLDQQTPLWLQGWKPGGNALLLELLDGRGEPLNPPFNSLLREVSVPDAGAVRAGRSPADPLSDLELAVLLGEQPVSVLPTAPRAMPAPPLLPAAPTQPSAPEGAAPERATALPGPPRSTEMSAAGEGVMEQGAPLSSEDALPSQGPAIAPTEPLPSPIGPSSSDVAATPPPPDAEGMALLPGPPSSNAPPAQPAIPPSEGHSPTASAWELNGADPAVEAPSTGDAPTAPDDQPDPVPSSAPDDRSHSAAPVTSRPSEAAAPAARAPLMEPAPSPSTSENTPMQSPAEAITPPSAEASRGSLPSAREEVNPDGTLRRPSRPSPLARLRERLGR